MNQWKEEGGLQKGKRKEGKWQGEKEWEPSPGANRRNAPIATDSQKAAQENNHTSQTIHSALPETQAKKNGNVE